MITLETLQTFCSADETRLALRDPFTHGEYTYATDGRIVVRVPAVGVFSIIRDANLPAPPNAALLFDHKEHGGITGESIDPLAIDVPPFTSGKCTVCAGTGFIKLCGCRVGCSVCDGNSVIPSSRDDLDSEDCEDCEKGVIYSYTGVMVGNRLLSNYYILKIRQLPLPKFAIFGDRNEKVAFTFDGGCGYLMPMRQNV